MARNCSVDHQKGNLPAELKKLPESQAGQYRHKCAACAYELGVQHGLRQAGSASKQARKLLAKVQQLAKVQHVH